MSERAAHAEAAGRGSATAVALAFLGLGGFVLWQGWTIGAEQSAYARVGPQVFPYIVGTGLVMIALLLLRDALRGAWRVVWVDAQGARGEAGGAALRQFGKVVLVACGLVLNAALIGPLGFVVASTLMFALTARAFGNRHILLGLAVGAAFSGAIYLAFVYGLGLTLPAGTLWKRL